MKILEKDGFVRGLGASLPIAVGYVPIAISFGLVSVQSGLGPWMTVSISTFIFAGASQFVLVSLLSTGAGFWDTLAVVLLMNSRHAFYGPLLARKLSPDHARFPRTWLAAGLTDEVFAISLSQLGKVNEQHRETWHIGLQVGAYTAWVIGTAIGAISSAQMAHLPIVHQAIHFVLPALFMALLLEFTSRDSLVLVFVAATVTATMLFMLPIYQAMPVGMLAGALSMSWRKVAND
jgi:4-azaleucine resistance transporter AzlC